MKNALILERRAMDVDSSRAKDNRIVHGRLAHVVALAASLALSAAALAATRVAVTLQGDIAPECAITGGLAPGAVAVLGATMDIPDITKPGRKDYRFTVNCNAPFDYRLEARFGALTHEGGLTGEALVRSGLANAVAYDVAMHIPTDGTTIDDRCSGESIRAGQVSCVFSNSGNGIALASQGNLMLAWEPKGTLAAGSYTDKLTIAVGARR